MFSVMEGDRLRKAPAFDYDVGCILGAEGRRGAMDVPFPKSIRTKTKRLPSVSTSSKPNKSASGFCCESRLRDLRATLGLYNRSSEREQHWV